MVILKLLRYEQKSIAMFSVSSRGLYTSEEIFDFSAEQMTSMKAKNLKNQMCGEFSEIFTLCDEVLQKAQKPSLIKATLETLLRFLNWIPLGYIFETTLIEMLRSRVRSLVACAWALRNVWTDTAFETVFGKYAFPKYHSQVSYGNWRTDCANDLRAEAYFTL
jgi:hypothetical protein